MPTHRCEPVNVRMDSGFWHKFGQHANSAGHLPLHHLEEFVDLLTTVDDPECGVFIAEFQRVNRHSLTESSVIPMAIPVMYWKPFRCRESY